jgi:hypothetical protein
MPDSLKEPLREGTAAESPVAGSTPKSYQTPRLTRIGNARELLAGADGSITDMDQSDPILFPNQSGG